MSLGNRTRCATQRLVFLLVVSITSLMARPTVTAATGEDEVTYRSPVDVAVTANGKWVVSANQSSGTASLIDPHRRAVTSEVSIGKHPIAIVPGLKEEDAWVTCRDSGTVSHLVVKGAALVIDCQFHVGFHPWGVCVDRERNRLYVAQRARGTVAALELPTGKVVHEWRIGNWPEWVALSPDGQQLVVTIPGDKGIALIDLQTAKADRRSFRALNSGRPVWSRDSRSVYLPWMVYRALAINVDNIRRGWVWGSRLGRLSADDSEPRRMLTLDERGRAVADVHGMVLAPQRQQLVVSAAGTHELLWFQLGQLPWRDYAATDHMDPRLIRDPTRFRRIELGGRPLGLALAPDESLVYVANYLRDSLQIISLDTGAIAGEIPLGGPSTLSPSRRGEAIFYDAARSLDQWYSCHTCHLDGGTNAVAIDTLNDGSVQTFKTVLPLFDVPHTAPWTWHGWQTDLRAAMTKSITSTMLGEPPSEDDIDALIAYLGSLRRPANPFREARVADAEAIRRGREVFQGAQANCIQCHVPPFYTDGEVHDVGTGSPSDKYDGYNTPVLRGLYGRRRFLHDGRVDSLEALLTGLHAPDRVAGSRPLQEQELQDLIAFLKSL